MTPMPDSRQRVLLVAGEASGDLHGARLVRQLRAARPELRIQAVGARRLREAGAEILCDCSRFSALGVYEALKRVPRLLLVLRRLRALLASDPPDLLVLIDFGAFNMRLLRFAHERGIKTLYYIPPGCWVKRMVSATRRVAALADYIATPFPWSERLLREAGGRAKFVGHPLLDLLEELPPAEEPPPGEESPIVALLPGSRDAEVRHILPLIARALRLVLRRHPKLRPVVSCAPTIARPYLEHQVRRWLPEAEITEDTYRLLRGARVGVIASGSATLEAAIVGLPMVVVYAGSWVSWIQYLLFVRGRIKYIALPNILADRELVPERYGERGSPEEIAAEVTRLIEDRSARDTMKGELKRVVSELGTPGAARRTAELALALLEGRGGPAESADAIAL